MPELRPRGLAIKEHGRRHHRARWDLVLAWWKRDVLAPALAAAFPGVGWTLTGTELAPAARGLVIETYAVVAGASPGRSLSPSG